MNSENKRQYKLALQRWLNLRKFFTFAQISKKNCAQALCPEGLCRVDFEWFPGLQNAFGHLSQLEIWAKLSKIKQPLIRCTGIFIIYSCTTMCNGGKKINLFFGSEVNERAQHLPKIYFSVWPLYMVWPLHTK